MAEIPIQQTFASPGIIVSTALDDLANLSDALLPAVDVGNPGPFAETLEVHLTGLAGAINYVEVWIQWSIDNVEFSDADNDDHIGNVQMNGVGVVKDSITFVVKARYYKLRFANRSGADLAGAGHVVRRSGLAVRQTTP